MAYWVLATYTRTSTETAWFPHSADIVAKVNEYKDSGKIVHYEIKESDNQLNQYIKIGFSNIAESLNFKDEPVVESNETARIAYGDSNPISWSVEDREEIEPTI
jgi:hypothetical protein|tara:strand:- start:702 stop:1013 length:312 start_codon:yes stop_codon:yes gene_type:complete